MLLRSLVEQTLPLGEAPNERRLSAEARPVVFRVGYIRSQRIIDISTDHEPSYLDSSRRGRSNYTPPKTFTYVTRQIGSAMDPRQLSTKGFREINDTKCLAGILEEMIDPASLNRASHVEHVAKRIKGRLALVAVIIGGGIAANILHPSGDHTIPSRDTQPVVLTIPTSNTQ